MTCVLQVLTSELVAFTSELAGKTSVPQVLTSELTGRTSELTGKTSELLVLTSELTGKTSEPSFWENDCSEVNPGSKEVTPEGNFVRNVANFFDNGGF